MLKISSLMHSACDAAMHAKLRSVIAFLYKRPKDLGMLRAREAPVTSALWHDARIRPRIMAQSFRRALSTGAMIRPPSIWHSSAVSSLAKELEEVDQDFAFTAAPPTSMQRGW